MRSITQFDVECYLAAASAADHRAAIDLALSLLRDGVAADSVLEDLLAEAQRETGRRWARAQWTVADEHVVTTTTSAVIEAVAAEMAAEPDDGELVVVCAEGDWHATPSRLFAERMRLRGWTVRFLGASTPADHVADYVTRSTPDGLVVSCAIPLQYAGAARIVDVAHAHGIPALVGGAAITGNPRRALALGADAAVSNVDDADQALRQLRGRLGATGPVYLDDRALLLDASADSFVDIAIDTLTRALPMVKGYNERQLRRTREDISYIIRFAAASLLVDDPAVWTDFAAWQTEVLAARDVPLGAFTTGVKAVANSLADTYPDAAALLARTTPSET